MRDNSLGRISFPLRGIALACLIVGITCLAALVIVASVRRSNTLATVALALAILTFVVQLIVYVVQASAANQQMLQGQSLFGSLQGLLSEIDQRMEVTQAAVGTINDTLLPHLLERAFKETSVTGVSTDSPDFVRRVTETARQIVENPAETREQYMPFIWDPVRDPPLLDQLNSLPMGDQARIWLNELLALDKDCQYRLWRYGVDENTFRTPSSTTAPGFPGNPPGPVTRKLIDLGLVEESEMGNGVKWTSLTQHGRELASFLIAPGRTSVYPELEGVMAELEQMRIEQAARVAARSEIRSNPNPS